MTIMLPSGWKMEKVKDFMVEVKQKVDPTKFQPTRYIGLEHIRSNGNLIGTGASNNVKSTKTVFKSNDVLYGKLRPYLNKHTVVYFDGVCSTDILVYRNSNKIASRYFNYWLNLPATIERLNSEAKGINLPRVSASTLNSLEILVPPKAEMERIVSKLDTLFAHLDQLKPRLEKIPALLKQFRQAVLMQAVTGKLTKEWRQERNVPESRSSKTLMDVIVEKPKNGYSPNPVNYKTEFRVLSLSATTSGNFISEHYKYFDEPIDIDSPYWLQPGDILVQRGNTLEYVGVAAIYDGQAKEFIYPDLMMRIRPNETVDTHFLYYILSSHSTRQYLRERATGTSGNMPKINQGTLMSVPILLPSLEEQLAIVRKVESLLAVAESIETNFQRMLVKIDKLSPTMLNIAFKGMLV